MGSIVRTALNGRFIKEFNDDFVKRLNFEGHFVLAQGLGEHEESLYYFVTVEMANKDQHELMVPDLVYDPDAGFQEDNVDRLCWHLLQEDDEEYDAKRAELLRRLTKAEADEKPVDLDNPECPHCGNMGLDLGKLGALYHFRCRGCGIDFTKEP